MNTYIQTDGTKTTCPFMKAPTLRPGYWWFNTSKLGASPMVYAETLAPVKTTK